MVMRRWRSGTACLVAAILAVPALAQTASPVSKSSSPVCDHARFRALIDVGHTLEEPGAISARGMPEYDFNLRLALHIERALREAGFSKTTLLVTDGKALPSLVKRVARANKQGGDLFLSIHHDSVPEKLIEKWTYEGIERSYSDRFRGHSMFISADNPQFRASLQFGHLLGKEMKEKGLQYTTHYTDKIMGARMRQLVDKEAGVYRFDQLVVLRMTQMPALLLEAGSIINRDEELLMASTGQQEKIAGAVKIAVEAFCALRTPRKTRAATTAAGVLPK
jgi:N-acetylmuramoyl-L-alanine amidase